MKKKRCGIAHKIGIGIVIAIAAAVYMAFGCSAQRVAINDPETHTVLQNAPALAPARALAPTRVSLEDAIAFRESYDRAWREQTPAPPIQLSEDGIITYVWIVHILAVVGIIGILTWIF
jgi:hypothetical protein